MVQARRYGTDLERAVFDATLDQLAEVGLAQMTMDSIASAAGTGKAALYRRWDNKAELVLDAVRAALPAPASIAPTGVLRNELSSLLVCIQEASDLVRTGVLRALVTDGGPQCRELLEQQVLQPCKDQILDALRRAHARGEVAASAVDALVAAVGPAMLIEHVRAGGVIDDTVITAVVDRLLLPLTRTPT